MKKLLGIVLIFAGVMSMTGTANAQSCYGNRFGVNISFGQSNYRPTIRRVVYTRRTYVRPVCNPAPIRYYSPPVCNQTVYRQPVYNQPAYRFSNSQIVYNQTVYSQPVNQPTLNCTGYGWHYTPSQGKHWHYRR